MNAETRAVIEAAMRLTPEQRELVVTVLSGELDDEGEESPEEVEAAWLAESRQRLAEVRSGAVTPIPWAEAKQRLSRPVRP